MAAAALQVRLVPATAATTSSSSSSCSNRASSRSVSVPCIRRDGASVFGSVARFETRQEVRRVVSRGGVRALAGEVQAEGKDGRGCRVIHGRCFVVGDNIDTDQIIPAEYLTLVPSKPEEYEKLGSYAMIGLPEEWGKFIEEGKMKTEYKVIIGGDNFGCGSSREHAPVALGAAGCRAVVAETYARIFFRNSVATGELYPVETLGKIWEENHTGDIVTLDMEKDVLVNHTTGKTYNLKPIGEAGPVIDAGGIFSYARSTGMIASPAQ
ncbi:hypothetical protein M758_6G095300 [Ceratodon purpureus]|nr:hypothetical protein M758_6G095300 [Ceratodon purpureus]